MRILLIGNNKKNKFKPIHQARLLIDNHGTPPQSVAESPKVLGVFEEFFSKRVFEEGYQYAPTLNVQSPKTIQLKLSTESLLTLPKPLTPLRVFVGWPNTL